MANWTDDQLEAIESRGQNLLVSAAAGSGKTAVLVERIIRMVVEDGVDIDNLMIVTFTNAAAGEMRERIMAALVDKLEMEGESEDIRRQISLLNRASITTVHSFCINVLRKNFHFLDLDPNFRIADATETKILVQEALEELLEDEYGLEEPDFVKLVESYSEDKGDLKLESLILKVYYFIQSQPYPLKWLFEKVENLNVSKEELLKSPWLESSMQEIGEELEECAKILEKAKRLAEEDEILLEKYGQTVIEDIASLKSLKRALEEGGFETLQREIMLLSHSRLKTLKKDEVEESLKQEVKSLRDEYKAIVGKLKDGILKKDLEDYRSDMLEMYPAISSLAKLVEKFTQRYGEKKSERGILDFNDLEHMTLELLEREEVSSSLRDKYEYIFVDEYQDSNIVQETIVKKVCRENNLFLVGDVKQSIYRFRLADPTLFIEKYFEYEKEENGESSRVDLSRNFRSRKQIIDGVNFLFEQLMSERLGEIDYGEDAYLYTGAEYRDIYDNSIELNIVDKKIKAPEEGVALSETDMELEDMQTAEVEAHFIADKIKSLAGEKTYDAKKGEYRDIDYKDMVILLRTMKNWAGVYEEVFVKEGIPIYTDDSSGYFEAMEVKVFLNLLSIVDNRAQDLPLLSVMRSPIGKFTVEELVAIRLHDRTASYHRALENYIEEVDDELSKKLSDFKSKVDRWKRESRYYKLDEFIWKLLVETGYYNYVGGMVNGDQRQANLRMLVDRANEFEKASINGLFNFIRFSDKLKDINGDMGTAKTIGENENVVRIMSIHKSKGLEFPVVFCGGLGKQFNKSDTRDELLLHKDLGIGAKYVDLESRRYGSSLPELAIKKKLSVENLSEELRILYVAFTRAKDKLFIYGTVNGLEKSCEKWSRGTNTHTLLKASCLLDWVCMALSKHLDGKEILARGGCSAEGIPLLEDESEWTVNFLEKAEILNIQSQEAFEKKEKKKVLESYIGDRDGDVRREVERRFGWSYPFEEATETPSKVSVTYLKNLESGKSYELKIPELVEYPSFMAEEKPLSAADRGTLNHRVLEKIPFDRNWSRQELEQYLKESKEKGEFTEEELGNLDIAGLELFLSSDIYSRILKSGIVKREQPFVYAKTEERELYIQGIIDCYFEEDGEYVIVDYKTDKVESESQLAKRYSGQLGLYREALESISNKSVKVSYIYSLHLGKEIEV